MPDEHESDRAALRALGEAIRQAREEQGLDVEQLAAAAGISPNQVQALEAGDVDVAARLVRQIPADEDEHNHKALLALGEAIRQIRQEQGLDVEQAAAASGISAEDVRALEAGGLNVSIYVLRLISAAAGATRWRLADLAEKLERYLDRQPSHGRDAE